MTAINGGRLLTDLAELSRIGGRPGGGIDRLAWSPADLEARQWFAERLRRSGLEARIDPALNVFGRAPGSVGPWLLVGSHLDSVPRGGRLDGSYGVVAALEVLRSLAETKDPLAERVEVVGFADEEGVRFGTGLLGSEALAGDLALDPLRQGVDWEGTPSVEVLGRAGVEIDRMAASAGHLADVFGYIELHIEQGPRMEAAGMDLAVVTGIVGVHRAQVRVEGVQNHAGTTPFALRRDAGRVAARSVAGLRELVQRIDAEAVANVGQIRFHPGGINIVPGRADFSLEVRHAEDAVVRRIVDAFEEGLRSIASADGCRVEVETRSYAPAAAMDPGYRSAIERACASLASRTGRLASGAGHDAQVMARHVPTGMLFVPSAGGISHSPEEHTDDEHLVLGARALLAAVRELAANS